MYAESGICHVRAVYSRLLLLPSVYNSEGLEQDQDVFSPGKTQVRLSASRIEAKNDTEHRVLSFSYCRAR